jgi:hypothetical protein
LLGRYGSEDEFMALLQLARDSEDVGDMHDYFEAAAATVNPLLARRVLEASSVPGLDPTMAIRMVGWVSQQHPALARDHFKQHAKGYLAGRSPQGQAEALSRAYQGFTDAQAAAELAQFADQTVPAEAMAEIRKAATRIRFEAGLKTRLVPAFDAWASKP